MKKLIFISLFIILHLTFTIEHCEAQWEPDVRLTNATGNSWTSYNNARCIAANGNVVHVVWYDYKNLTFPKIYFKRSINGGTTWGTETLISSNYESQYYPSIAVFGSQVHVVGYEIGAAYPWINEWSIIYRRSTDEGITWDNYIWLMSDTAYSEFPSVAVSGSQVHVVWGSIRDGNKEIYYKRAINGSWGADTRLTNNTADSYFPSVAVFGSQIHIVWWDNRDGNSEIYYKRSTDGGTIWETDTRLTNNTAGSQHPSVSVSGLLVHIVWEELRDMNWEIYYKRSIDGGTTWGADTRLTNNSAVSGFPSVAVSGLQVNVVWCDHRDGNFEIYYKRSTDDGTTWGADTRLTNNTAYSYYPSVAVSGSQVHVVWCDNRDGNFEIYYKRNPTGNVGIQNISTEMPSAYSLEQNYPNPFNSNTIIRFQIKDSRFVNLKVFDILGKEVATLVNEYLKPGTYETTFDASTLTGGIYFYRLQTENYTATKKLILLK